MLIDEEFLIFNVMNQAWLSRDFLASNHSKINDGFLNAIMVRNESNMRFRLSLAFLDTPNAAYLKQSFTTCFKAKAVKIELENSDGIFDIDGEILDYKSLHMECFHKAINLIAPNEHSTDHWSR